MSWQWIFMIILAMFQLLGWLIYFRFVRGSRHSGKEV